MSWFSVAAAPPPTWATAEMDEVTLWVVWEEGSAAVEFVATSTDTDPDGTDLWTRAIAGEFGEISAYEPGSADGTISWVDIMNTGEPQTVPGFGIVGEPIALPYGQTGRDVLDTATPAAARAVLGVPATGGADDYVTTGKFVQGAPSVPVGGSQQYIQSHRAGAAGASFVRYSADIYGPDIRIAKSRSPTIGTPGAAVQAGDTLGTIHFIADDGTDLANAAASISAEAAATATADSIAADLVLWTVPSGTTRTERLRVTSTGNIQVGGGNTVISSARHILLRSYTVATLPSASPAAQMIYVSNGTSNKRLAVSDGTNWRWPDGAIVS